MRKFSYFLFLLATTCEAYANWWLEVGVNRTPFNEASGSFPLFAGVVGAPLAICAFIAWLLSQRKQPS